MHVQQTPPAAKTYRRESTRIAGLDAARIIACLGVIWLHAGYSDYNVLGYFRMPFFSALLAFLVATGLIRNPGRRFRAFARSRAFRILLPFAIWLVLYRIPNLWKGHLVVSLTFRHVLMGLGTVPLWFLTFAFCASLLAYGLARSLQRVPFSRRWIAATALLALGSLWSYVAVFNAPGDLWEIGMPLLGAVALGVALAFFRESPRVRRFITRQWLIWTLLWVAFALLSISTDIYVASFLGTVSGLFLLLAGLSVPLPAWPAFWAYLGRLSYGMYLTHWAFVMLLEHLHFNATGSAPLRFTLIVAGSFTSTAILQKMRWGRFLLGVESFAKRNPQPPRTLSNPSAAPSNTAPALAAAPA